MRFSDLWKPGGTVDRRLYAAVGFIGFAIKHNLDRIVAVLFFHRPWNLFNYWLPLKSAAPINALGPSDIVFLATMVLMALPFIWLGVSMTLKRLRSTHLPLSLVLLFFVPFLNLLFFLLLCLLPAKDGVAQDALTRGPKHSRFSAMVPHSALGSAAFATLFTAPLGLAFAVIGAQVFVNYGWGLFVALPFTLGFAAALIFGIHEPRNLPGCIGVACLSNLLVGAALLAFAFEGAVCLIMAAPIALPLACFGGFFGYLVQRRRWFSQAAPAFLSALLLVVPGVQGTEHVVAPAPVVYVVRSAVDIQAPPEKVWQKVIAFTEIAPPTELIFRAGIAYPIRAEMFGSGPGAERHCVFSTGAFVEPIEVWDAPRRLKFSVTANPAPMQEWSPYAPIHPPHLQGFLLSRGGQFLLTPLANGGTRLQGTTWYVHSLWPAAYWRLWSDSIIHQIHLRVLTHIRDQAQR